MADIARLEIQVDSSPLITAAEGMERLAGAAAAVQQALKGMQGALQAASQVAMMERKAQLDSQLKAQTHADKLIQIEAQKDAKLLAQRQAAAQQALAAQQNFQNAQALAAQAHANKMAQIEAQAAARRRPVPGTTPGSESGGSSSMPGLPGSGIWAAFAAFAMGGVAGGVAAVVGELIGGLKKLGSAMADVVTESTLLAARSETLSLTMAVAGNNAGYSANEMEAYARTLQKMGISVVESKQVLTSLAAANIDMSRATQLARAAQDLAVVGNMNSSQTLERLTHAIRTGNVQMLHRIGLSTTFMQGYKQLAAEQGKHVKALSDEEKMNARVTQVTREAIRYTSLYETAMQTASKQIKSMERYAQDLKTKFGELFTPALSGIVFAITDVLKSLIEGIKDLSPEVYQFQRSLQLLFETIGGGKTFTDILLGGLRDVLNIGTRISLAYAGAVAVMEDAIAAVMEKWDKFIKKVEDLLKKLKDLKNLMPGEGGGGGADADSVMAWRRRQLVDGQRRPIPGGSNDNTGTGGNVAEFARKLVDAERDIEVQKKVMSEFRRMSDEMDILVARRTKNRIELDRLFDVKKGTKVDSAAVKRLADENKGIEDEIKKQNVKMDEYQANNIKFFRGFRPQTAKLPGREGIEQERKDREREEAKRWLEQAEKNLEILQREQAEGKVTSRLRVELEGYTKKLTAAERERALAIIETMDAIDRQKAAEAKLKKEREDDKRRMASFEEARKAALGGNKEEMKMLDELAAHRLALIGLDEKGIYTYEKLGISQREFINLLNKTSQALDPVIVKAEKAADAKSRLMMEQFIRTNEVNREADNSGAGKWEEWKSGVNAATVTRQAWTKAWFDIMKSTDTFAGYMLTAGEGLANTLGDAFANMALRGENSFRDMMKSWADQMTKMLANKAFLMIFQWALGFIPGASPTTGAATTSGATTSGGSTGFTNILGGGAQVGGPGNSFAYAGGGPQVNVTVNMNGGGGDVDVQSSGSSGQQLGTMLGNVVRSAMVQEMRPGGILYRSR